MPAPPSSSADLIPLTVCMVGPHHPRPGGVTIQVEALARALRADGVVVHAVDTNVQAVRGIGPLGRALLPLAQVLVVPWRLRCAARRADLIHVHLASNWGFYLPMLAIAWARLWRNTPVVASYHGGAAGKFVRTHPRSVARFLPHITELISSSQAIAAVFEALGRQVTVIPNLIDLDQLGSDGAPRAAAAANAAPRLLWIKRFDATGHPELMLRAFARVHAELPAARLLMIGDGERLPAMQALAAAQHLPVEFAGRVPVERLRAAYREATVFVSSSAVDNQPNTLIEASALGLPIVATAVGGVPEMVHDGEDALLTPPNDAPALAATILRLLHETELAGRLGAAARANAERFTWPALRPQWAEVYRKASGRLEYW